MESMKKTIKNSAGITANTSVRNHQIQTKVFTNSGNLLLGEKVLQLNGVELAKSSDRR
jgi:hypothetical protein